MLSGPKPVWLTFDCYGTLIQWDEGLLLAVKQILEKQSRADFDPAALIRIYDAGQRADRGDRRRACAGGRAPAQALPRRIGRGSAASDGGTEALLFTLGH